MDCVERGWPRAEGDDAGLLVCGAIVTPMEGAYGNQERHPGRFAGGGDPQAVFAKDGLFDELKKALAERVLNAEIDDHLDGEAAAGKRNSRNGYSKKTVLTETSKLDLRIPRDREGTFDPKLIARYQRRFPGFDEKIVSMYARGMTVREIRAICWSFMALRSRPISFRR